MDRMIKCDCSVPSVFFGPELGWKRLSVFFFVSNDSITSTTPGGSGEAEVDRMTSDFGARIFHLWCDEIKR